MDPWGRVRIPRFGCRQIPSGAAGFQAGIKPFFEANCIKCHGPEKNKGKVTLYTLDGNPAPDETLEIWETILDMVESGEMPPEDEPQPSMEDRAAVVQWIEAGLRGGVRKAEETPVPVTARRQTNFEYQNTMRDLLGFELKFIDDLSNDPVASYKFNNTADLMSIGPEQIDRSLECARRAMASAIIDPEKPEAFNTRREWTLHPLRPGTVGGHGRDGG